MAFTEIVLAPLLEVIFEKLASPVVQKMAEFWELDDRFKKLQQVLLMVQAVLEDAEKQQATNKAVRVWLSELKDAACKAEDLLEEFAYKGKYSGTYSVNFVETRNILDELQKAAIQGLNLQLTEKHIVDRESERRETSSFIVGSEFYGREEDKKRITELLLSSSSETPWGRNVTGVSIVGIPGIGKTTLAQLVYNSEEVKKHFDLRIWIFVSHEFRAKNVMKAAIESASGNKCEFSQLEMLHSKLWDVLCKKRYLIVLDDVWNEEQDSWDQLKPLFRGGIDGSKILVTTRSQKVVMSMDFPNMLHQLKGLPEYASWDLFRRQVFHQREEDKFQNLLAIGKEITRKCLGVPLAIKIIAGLMRFKREEREWVYMQKSNLWNLHGYRNRILSTVELSYLHLPSCLKHCFAFCSTFPKNYDIEKEKLIHMWMAHGLILLDGGSKRLEEIGDEYFNELLRMSFLEDVKECYSGSVAVYRIHDLFYDFAETLTRNESMVVEKGFPRMNLSKIRHASRISDYRSSIIAEPLHEAKHLRTLLVYSYGLQEVPSNVFSSFTYLRVLRLSGCHVELPESIGGVPFLRYLDLSKSHFHKLPSAISSICSLVTLDLFSCYNLRRLPGMGRITSLRHLNIRGCEALIEMPDQIEKLVDLQTLPIYIVPSLPKIRRKLTSPRCPPARWRKSPGICALQDLDLHGELKIKHLERVRDAEEAKAANLQKKEYLESIGLCWGPNGADFVMNPSPEAAIHRLQEKKQDITETSQEPEMEVVHEDQELAGEVLASLQPHQNLKKLFIVGYPGFKFPLWMLPKLIVLELVNCRGCLHLPTLGHLPFLQVLRMESMNSVTTIGQEFYGRDANVFFPSLQELTVRNFPVLQEWSSPDGIETFPQLSKLILRSNPNLNSTPQFSSVRHLELQGCRRRVLECMETSSLSTLVIAGFDELSCIPAELWRRNFLLNHLKISSCPNLQSLGSELGGLASLRSLTIRWCENLVSLPNSLQNLTSLEYLEISDCKSLRTLPENGIGHLKSLRDLSVENCSDLVSISSGLEELTALEHLTIMYCPSLASFPDGPQHLPALRTLNILSCPEITFLPEGLRHATLLQCLEIRSCPKFTAFPDWLDNLSSLRSLAISDCPSLKSLPNAIQRLAALQHISIQECPDLQRRCHQDRGVDWWKIAHVPHRYIFSTHPQQFTYAPSSSV